MERPRADAHQRAFLKGGDISPSIVMPAKAGIHSHRPVFMDSGFRRNDNEGVQVTQITGNVHINPASPDNA
jgi:hypothetical protein